MSKSGMKKSIKYVSGLVVVVIGLFFGTGGELTSLNSSNYRVVDGDTFKVGDKTYRLALVDTPESCVLKQRTNEKRNSDGTCKTNKSEERLGKEASKFTKDFFDKGKDIKIESTGKTDRYSREVVWVFDGGKLLQEELALNGFVEGYYTINGSKLKNKDYKNYKKLKGFNSGYVVRVNKGIDSAGGFANAK